MSLVHLQATLAVRGRIKKKTKHSASCGVLKLFAKGKVMMEKDLLHEYSVGHGWGSLAKAYPMPRFGVRVWTTTKPIALVGVGLQRHCQEN